MSEQAIMHMVIDEIIDKEVIIDEMRGPYEIVCWVMYGFADGTMADLLAEEVESVGGKWPQVGDRCTLFTLVYPDRVRIYGFVWGEVLIYGTTNVPDDPIHAETRGLFPKEYPKNPPEVIRYKAFSDDDVAF